MHYSALQEERTRLDDSGCKEISSVDCRKDPDWVPSGDGSGILPEAQLVSNQTQHGRHDFFRLTVARQGPSYDVYRPDQGFWHGKKKSKKEQLLAKFVCPR